jgi:hypothetical protein
MSFRSRANPDQRRRRVILDDLRNEEMRAPAPVRQIKRRRYADDALTDAQPRITDFLPSTWRPIVLLLISMFVVDGGVLALDWFQPQWAEQISELPLRTINAGESDSLAQFWLTIQCALATIVSLLIFAVRRRRLDDLRGTYQSWIWVALFSGLMTLISGTAVEELISFGIARIPNVPALSPPLAWFWVALSALAGPMLLRLLIEMRKLRASQIVIIIAVLLGAASQAMEFVPLDVQLAKLISQGLLLSSGTLLVGALLSYGRYVKLDASGAFSVRKKKKKREVVEEETSESDESDTTSTRVDAGTSSVSRPNSIGAAISAARASDLDGRRSGPLSTANRQQAARR